MAMLDRFTADPAIFGGKPIVRGMRISVELVLSLLAQGETQQAILEITLGWSRRTSGPPSPTRTPPSPMIGWKTLRSPPIEISD